MKLSTGTSKKYFTNTTENKIYSTGQGIAWSGPIWGNTNDVIIKSMNNNCQHIIHTNPNKTLYQRETLTHL